MAKETQLQRVLDTAPSLRKALLDVTDEHAQRTAELAVGNLYMDKEGDLVRIRVIQEHSRQRVEKRYSEKYVKENLVAVRNEAGKDVYFFILYDMKCYSKDYYTVDEDGWTKRSEHDGQYSDIFLRGLVRLTQTEAEYDAETLAFIESGDYSPYGLTKDGSELALANRGGTDEDASQELLHVGSKEHLAETAKGLQEQRNHIQLIHRSVQREMNKRKAELEAMRQNLAGVLEVFKKKLQRIYRVIRSIELYLGINEDIIQIQEGEKAPVETPITFRQQILYMNEEIGVLMRDGDGMDFQDIHLFDEWLLRVEDKRPNYSRLLPEEKGVVVLRVRREEKDYGDPLFSAMMNVENMKTYLLIRNGTNIFRIWADINVYPRLFPSRTELQDLIDKVNKHEARDYVDAETKKDELDKVMQMYKERVLMMQGLIDRTDILHPIARPINLFHLEADQDLVNFIYDDSEHTLPSGRLPFPQWVKSINAQITRGSRVLLSGHWGRDREWVSPKHFKDRFLRYYTEWGMPDLPGKGLYSVENVKGHQVAIGQKRVRVDSSHWHSEAVYGDELEEMVVDPKATYTKGYLIAHEDGKPVVLRWEPKLFIAYNPGGEVRSGWGDWEGHDRKNNLSFEIFRGDHFVLNYDLIQLEDVEYYLNSRVDRPHYLQLLPLLREIKWRRLDELKWEKDFALLVESEVRKAVPAERLRAVDVAAVVWEAITWWKSKVIWQRPITKDDAKALRMIRERVTKLFTK